MSYSVAFPDIIVSDNPVFSLVRSDGGADCLKLHEASAVAGKMTMNGRTTNENFDLMGGRGGGGLGVTKVEDKAWPAGVVL